MGRLGLSPKTLPGTGGRRRVSLMCWVVPNLLDTSPRWQCLLSLRGNQLQSIWLIMQEKQRKTQEEAALGSQAADPSGKAWEDSPWAPSGTRDVSATAQQAEPLALGPRPLGLLLWAPLHSWADRGQRTGWGRAWALEADLLGHLGQAIGPLGTPVSSSLQWG